MSNSPKSYQRPQAAELARRLAEPRRFIQVVAGPRQVGKTTLVQQVTDAVRTCRCVYASADEPTLRGPEWIAQQWEAARLSIGRQGSGGAVLVLDEVQKASGWSESVKRLWDEDTRARSGAQGRAARLGAAARRSAGSPRASPGASRSCTLPHWSLGEMRARVRLAGRAFHRPIGGYPGAAPLVDEPERWRRYIRDSLIETTIARDVLLLTRVDKPALLAAALRTRLPLLRPGALVHQDARPAPGRGQHDHPRPLPRPARCGGHADGTPEVRGAGRPPARLEPEAAGARHGAA